MGSEWQGTYGSEQLQMLFWDDEMMSGCLKWKVGWSSLTIFAQRIRFIREIATAVFDLEKKYLGQILRLYLEKVRGQQLMREKIILVIIIVIILAIFVWISVAFWIWDECIYYFPNLLLLPESFISTQNIVAMMGFTCCKSSIKSKIQLKRIQLVLRHFHQVFHYVWSLVLNSMLLIFYKASETFFYQSQWKQW